MAGQKLLPLFNLLFILLFPASLNINCKQISELPDIKENAALQSRNAVAIINTEFNSDNFYTKDASKYSTSFLDEFKSALPGRTFFYYITDIIFQEFRKKIEKLPY